MIELISREKIYMQRETAGFLQLIQVSLIVFLLKGLQRRIPHVCNRNATPYVVYIIRG